MIIRLHAIVGLLAVATSLGSIPLHPIQADEAAHPVADPAGIEQVELFEGIETKLISVKFIPLGSDRANVIFQNHSDRALDVALPPAFGAVHVVGQLGNGLGAGGAGLPGLGGPGGAGLGAQGGFGAAGGGLAGAGGGGQGLGGGFGAGLGGGGNLGGGGIGGGNIGGGGWGNGNGRGLFRIEPDKSRKLSVNTVCLEHGKRDPNPRLHYQIVPLQLVNTAANVERLCIELGNGRVEQPVAQAAAWHLANALSWEQLAAKNRVESRFTGNERYFKLEQLQAAAALAAACTAQADSAVESSYSHPSSNHSTSHARNRDSQLSIR